MLAVSGATVSDVRDDQVGAGAGRHRPGGGRRRQQRRHPPHPGRRLPRPVRSGARPAAGRRPPWSSSACPTWARRPGCPQPLRFIAGVRGGTLDREVAATSPEDRGLPYVDIAGQHRTRLPGATRSRYFAADRYHPSDDGYRPLGRRHCSRWSGGRSSTGDEPAAGVVRDQRSRPAVAAHPRPVGRPGGGARAAADPGGAGGRPLAGAAGALPRPGRLRGRTGGRGGAGVGRARLQPPGRQPPPRRRPGGGPARGPHAGDAARAARAAGGRARTPPGRCWRSRSRRTWACST